MRALRAIIPLLLVLAGLCPSVAAGKETNPMLWGASPHVDRVAIDALSCPSSALCVAVDQHGGLLFSDHPAGGARSWKRATLAASGLVDLFDVSCASTRLCVAVDTTGDVVASTDPASSAPSWTVAHVDSASTAGYPSTALDSVSCPTVSLCVAVDSAGDAVTSTDPSGGATAWSVTHIDDGTDYECYHYGETGPECQPGLGPVACASSTACVALDDAGNVLSSADPTGGASGWAPARGQYISEPSDEALDSLACPTASLCIAAESYSNVIFTGGPSGFGYSYVTIGAPETAISGVWCASASLCFADIDAYPGGLYASSDPLGPASTWKVSYPAPVAINSVSCPSPKLCFAAAGTGDVIVGRAPVAADRIRRSIMRQLIPSGADARITALRDRAAYKYTVRALEAGRLVIKWYAATTTPTRASVKLIATGTARFDGAGDKTMVIRLNRSAKRFLERANSLRLTARAGFTPTGSSTVITVTRDVTLTG